MYCLRDYSDREMSMLRDAHFPGNLGPTISPINGQEKKGTRIENSF